MIAMRDMTGTWGAMGEEVGTREVCRRWFASGGPFHKKTAGVLRQRFMLCRSIQFIASCQRSQLAKIVCYAARTISPTPLSEGAPQFQKGRRAMHDQHDDRDDQNHYDEYTFRANA
jgi:hypothetical protein